MVRRFLQVTCLYILLAGARSVKALPNCRRDVWPIYRPLSAWSKAPGDAPSIG